VLVGKSGADNDTLTFRIAAPHDFWFHAAGRAGAHVIVRNPRRLRELPEPALTEAAAIAAWFSRGERTGEIDVHYARRKDVRKGKGMSPGMVMLRSYRTVRVRPALPDGDAGD
jgi:predicted ribosome quality control (RQC) complex YloA/Tae2 family protein